jgi:metal-sulfur cluster biosynthetic enzyme
MQIIQQRQRTLVIRRTGNLQYVHFLSFLMLDLLSTISDPEHPLALSKLAVVQLHHSTVKDNPSSLMSYVLVEITPTIPHCSMATLIGLCIRVRLERALPQPFRVDTRVRPCPLQSENQVTQQLDDKERVAAAFENEALLKVLHGCSRVIRNRRLTSHLFMFSLAIAMK